MEGGARPSLPALRQLHLLRAWAGTIARIPDVEPIFGECPGAKGFFVMVFPEGAAGLTVGPVVGRLMAELLTEGVTSISMEAYGPGRFAGQPA